LKKIRNTYDLHVEVELFEGENQQDKEEKRRR
jgi:hypothetical protein